MDTPKWDKFQLLCSTISPLFHGVQALKQKVRGHIAIQKHFPSEVTLKEKEDEIEIWIEDESENVLEYLKPVVELYYDLANQLTPAENRKLVKEALEIVHDMFGKQPNSISAQTLISLLKRASQ